MKGGKTTALVGLPLTDQWEGRDDCNLDREASLARNIARKPDAIPRGEAISIYYPAEKMKSTIA